MSKKSDFYFEYTVPSLDWYETERVTIKPKEYSYFAIQRRYGGTWWLKGIKFENNPYRKEEKELGQLTPYYLVRFIKWCENDDYIKGRTGSDLIGINMLCGEFNIIDEIKELLKLLKQYENNE